MPSTLDCLYTPAPSAAADAPAASAIAPVDSLKILKSMDASRRASVTVSVSGADKNEPAAAAAAASEEKKEEKKVRTGCCTSTGYWHALNRSPEHGRKWSTWLGDLIVIFLMHALGGGCQEIFDDMVQRDYSRIPFYLNDPNLSAPGYFNMIDGMDLVKLCWKPLIIYVFVALFPPLSSKKTWAERFAEAQVVAFGLALALGINLMFQGPLTVLQGEFRPSMLQYCDPDPTRLMYHNQECNASGFVQCSTTLAEICPESMAEKGFFNTGKAGRSYVSGHASYSGASFTYFMLWFSGKTRAFCSGRERAAWKLMIVGLAVLGSLCISASRVLDRNHHSWNCLFGLVIGWGRGAAGLLLLLPKHLLAHFALPEVYGRA